MSTFELDLAGPVPRAVADMIRDRFGEVAVRRLSGHTVLEGRIADQAAIRALLDLVWDMGCEVRLLRVATDSAAGPGALSASAGNLSHSHQVPGMTKPLTAPLLTAKQHRAAPRPGAVVRDRLPRCCTMPRRPG